jgi:dipeptidyl-peptidase-3
MGQLRKGVLGLTLYNPETKKWGQAHTQGAYVMTQWFYKNQKSKIVDFEMTEEGNSFLIHLNEENLMNEGRELIKQLLLVLQTFRASGCAERGKKFYEEYSEVTDFFLNIRSIVVKNKKARRIELNNNLMRYNEKCIEIVHYPETFESICLSFAERYPFSRKLYDEVRGVWDEHREDLRV